ncbi:sugar phosphate isomerase/epimerase [Desulfurococcaceae archaeon MEX13E-LK6-19]|nr:sugar phosphate isomerase/epimerase [Desulfurococcaceae archaeon MEX13E-LK6-19]
MGFKLGVNIWSYPKSLDIRDIMKHAAKTGYNGFEPAITLDDIEVFGSSSFDEKWRRISEEASSLGLEIPSIATGLFWRYNWVKESDVEKALRVVEAEAKAASIVGAKVILVVPGVGVPELSYEEHFEKAVKALSRAEKIARDYGVRIGLEKVWNRVFAGPLEFKKLLDNLDPEVFGAYFDVGNTLPHSLPEHWIEVLGKRILQVHVKGFNMAELRFGIPLFGDINWSVVRKRLEEIGYKGFIVAEVPPYRGDPYKAVEDTFTSLKKIFG